MFDEKTKRRVRIAFQLLNAHLVFVVCVLVAAGFGVRIPAWFIIPFLIVPSVIGLFVLGVVLRAASKNLKQEAP
jgi:hypothetical protein